MDGFASISLHQSDRIRLLHFPPADIAAIRDVINQNWPSGIQEERTYAESHEFKCSGKPWAGKGGDAIQARVLTRGLLAHLFAHGWTLTVSTDVCRSVYDKDTMIFRKQADVPPPSKWVAISFNKGDRLRLIGAPMELVDAFMALLMDMELCQDSGWKDRALEAFEFKIHGRPWLPRGEKTMTTRLLLLRMLETLEAGGWSLYAAVDQNNGYQAENSSATGTDSWYCVRAVDWVPGNRVIHR